MLYRFANPPPAPNPIPVVQQNNGSATENSTSSTSLLTGMIPAKFEYSSHTDLDVRMSFKASIRDLADPLGVWPSIENVLEHGSAAVLT